MITFHKIHIQNFKSVKDVHLKYQAGLFNIIGNNLDAPFNSNGSGKSTILEAVIQCLFNRTILLTPIEQASRHATGSGQVSPYVITVWFTKGNDQYKIINDRAQMKVTIVKNGTDLGVKSIPVALRTIQDIVGMDVNTFITLTFITQTTVNSLLENFASSNLMKVVLDFDKISSTDKAMKVELKELTNNVNNLAFVIKSIKDSINILGQYKEIDTTAMKQTKATITDTLDTLLLQKGTVEYDINTYNKNTIILANLQKELKDIQGTHTCSACGSVLAPADQEVINSKQSELIELSTKLNLIDYSDLQNQLESISKEVTTARQRLSKVSEQIIAADTKNQMYTDAISKSEDLRKNLADKERDMSNYKEQQLVIASAVAIIKKGDMHKELLGSFTTVLNKYLAKFKEFINLQYVGIVASAKKGSIGFRVFDSRFNTEIHTALLSGGEKTRLRLILLLAMLATIQDMTNSSTNLLVFDEALDTLDASSSGDLANLFSYLVNHDNKFIALISHGQQLKDIEFSGEIVVTKNKGESTVEVQYE